MAARQFCKHFVERTRHKTSWSRVHPDAQHHPVTVGGGPTALTSALLKELAPNTEDKLELYVMEGDKPQVLVLQYRWHRLFQVRYDCQVYLIRAPNTTRDLLAALSLLMGDRVGAMERGGVVPHIPRRSHIQQETA